MRITKNRLVVLVGLLVIGGLLLTLGGAFTGPTSQLAANLQPTPIPPTRTPLPTATPKPTATPVPTNTPQPTATPEPTATPTPVPTATPTPIPTPTPTPKIAFADRFSFLPTDTVKQLRPGVIQVQRIEPGPIRLNVLLFDLTAPEFDLQVVLPHGTLQDGVERTSAMGKENNALAAVNGDLFSGNGLPQGLTVSNNKLAVSPKHRATFAYSKTTGPFIGYFTQTFSWPAKVVAANGEQHSLEVLNAVCKVDWMCLYNDLFGDLAAGSNDVRVLIDENNQVTAIKQEAYMKIPEGSQLLVGKGQAGKWLLQNVNIGDLLDLRLTTDPDYHKFSQIVSGGPVFLRDGEFIQDCLCNLEDCGDSPDKNVTCEEFTTEWKYLHYLKVRMPRNAIGYNDDKTVLVSAVVDGYQPNYSIGMTQKEEADLMTEFGATTAMELDGGGSATMWVNGKLASHPSDGNGSVERMVPDAVVFNWNGPADESDSADDSTTTTPQATSRYGTPTPSTTRNSRTTPTPSPSASRRGTPTPKPTKAPSNSR